MNNKHGFSTTELLGIVAIVIVLFILAIPSFKNTTAGAKESAAIRNAETLNSCV